jgi:hypothetical protein
MEGRKLKRRAGTMSANQKTRLLVAAKDLVRALAGEKQKDEDLLPVLASLRFELASACEATTPATAESL